MSGKSASGLKHPKKFPIPHRQRHRPVLGGVSVGLEFTVVNFRFAGTVGVVVGDRKDPHPSTP